MVASSSAYLSMKRAALAAALMLTIPLAMVPAIAQEAPPVAEPHDEPGLIPERAFMTTAMDFVGRYSGRGREGGRKDGFYPSFGSFYTGAGWLSVGGGYRHSLLDDRAVLDGEALVSWRGYKQLRGRFEFPLLAGGHLALGTEATWRDLMQVNYFGAGADSLEANRSEYRIKTTDIVGYASVRAVRWLAVRGEAGWLNRPTLSSPAGPNDRDYPDARQRFFDEPAFALERQPRFLHGGVSVTADTRDYPSHPRSGGLYRAAWTTYSDRDLDGFAFQHYEAEAFHALPIVEERFTVLVHGWTVASETAADQIVPVYMLPSLGGSSTLRSFPDFRFHDRHMLVASVESRIALFAHVDLAGFVDAGNVAPRFSELDLDKRSYGLGLRVHTHEATTARVDVAMGAEGWKLTFSLNDPFRLRRVTRTAMAVPFVP